MKDPNTEYKASVHKCKIQIVEDINIEIADVFVVVFEKKKQIKLKTLTHKGYSPLMSGLDASITELLLKNPKGPAAPPEPAAPPKHKEQPKKSKWGNK